MNGIKCFLAKEKKICDKTDRRRESVTQPALIRRYMRVFNAHTFSTHVSPAWSSAVLESFKLVRIAGLLRVKGPLSKKIFTVMIRFPFSDYLSYDVFLLIIVAHELAEKPSRSKV